MKEYHFEFYWMDRVIAKRLLEEVVDFFEEQSVQLQIDCGTLLGAYREGNFIVYDHDVDCSMSYEDFKRVQDIRIKNPKLFAEAGIISSAYLVGPEKIPKALVTSKYNTKVDIYVRFEKDGMHNVILDHKKDRVGTYQSFQVPSYFHNNPQPIEFMGREYLCPADPEKYLSLIYGKYWNIRIKTGGIVNEVRKLGEIKDFIPKEILEEAE